MHGAWVTPACWDAFRGHFEAKGYRCLAPAWPHVDRPVQALRADPAPQFAALTIKDLVDHSTA